jgi:hypothetical protein
MLYDALSHIGETSLNNDVNLIGSLYWNWKLPNISKFIDKIMTHYDKTQEVFYIMPNRERQSSIGRHWRLYKHLQLVGYPCKKNMFKISNMEESVNQRVKLWKIMCEQS